MDFKQLMTIYRKAVDQTATTAESSDWWREVQAEIEAVITAPTKTAADHRLVEVRVRVDAVWRLSSACRRPHSPGGEDCFEITGKTISAACSRRGEQADTAIDAAVTG